MTKIVIFRLVVLALLLLGLGTLYLVCWLIKKHRAVGFSLLALLLALAGYNYWDNQRVVLKTETVYIHHLPAAFEGFKILQVTDLHGKVFGTGQDQLAQLINGTGCDLIAYTGDMEDSSDSFAAFVELLDQVDRRPIQLYINGNYDLAYGFLTGIKTASGVELEQHGAVLLTEPYPLERDGAVLWLVNDLTKTYRNIDVYQSLPRFYFATAEQYRAYQQHFARLEEAAARINASGAVKIGLAHIPQTRADIEKPAAHANRLDYDLILAGHYHGGQIRIPFYGALFIPRYPWLDSFFPDQREVSGLMSYATGVQQYVSRGLGASNIPFRLFNTPEINLITLRSQ